MLVIGSRLSEVTSYGDTIPRADVPWIHVDIEPSRPADLPQATRTIVADARAFLRAANDRMLGKAVLDAALVRERQEHNARIVRPGKPPATSRPSRPTGPAPASIPVGRSPRCAASFRTTPSSRPMPATSPVGPGAASDSAGPGTYPRPDVRGHGLRRARGHRGGPGPSRTDGRGAGRRRRLRDDHGRARDRGPGTGTDHRPRLRQRALRHDPDVAGRAGDRPGCRDRTRPGGRAGIARALGARGVRVDADADLEPALRQALAEDRPTVIQLALDRAWVSVDRPPAAS